MTATFDQAIMAEGVAKATMFASKCVVITDLGTRCLERDKACLHAIMPKTSVLSVGGALRSVDVYKKHPSETQSVSALET